MEESRKKAVTWKSCISNCIFMYIRRKRIFLSYEMQENCWTNGKARRESM